LKELYPWGDYGLGYGSALEVSANLSKERPLDHHEVNWRPFSLREDGCLPGVASDRDYYATHKHKSRHSYWRVNHYCANEGIA
jgi:hypothetical protein